MPKDLQRLMGQSIFLYIGITWWGNVCGHNPHPPHSRYLPNSGLPGPYGSQHPTPTLLVLVLQKYVGIGGTSQLRDFTRFNDNRHLDTDAFSLLVSTAPAAG